jgi:hypothetical protein
VAVANLGELRQILESFGLVLRGGFRPAPEDEVPAFSRGRACASLLMLGNVGSSIWPAFSTSPEKGDGQPHALDRWTRRVIDAIAGQLGAQAFYPFGGPPWLPFQRWARRAESLAPSPLGILIHPEFGLWHAYRGALGFAETVELPALAPRSHPCDSCAERPCLSSCPVRAFTAGGYDVKACRQHVMSMAGASCREEGCRARLACPVGRAFVYPPAQMGFHMAAFLSAR